MNQTNSFNQDSNDDLTLYWISGSAPAWRVLLFMEFKGFQFHSHILETSRKEQKQEWFLNLNPRGQIPLLKHGDICVTESLAIMRYLDFIRPSPALFGDCATDVASIEETIQQIIAYVDKPVANYVQPVFRNKVEDNIQSIEAAIPKIASELEQLNRRLSEQIWLSGSNISTADIFLVPTLQRLIRAINKLPELARETGMQEILSQQQHLLEWNSRIEEMDEFKKTFPPHWK